MTKKTSNGVAIGLWVVGAMVAIYLICGVLFIAQTNAIYRMVPRPAFMLLSVVFTPVVQAFEAFGYFDEIRNQ